MRNSSRQEDTTILTLRHLKTRQQQVPNYYYIKFQNILLLEQAGSKISKTTEDLKDTALLTKWTDTEHHS